MVNALEAARLLDKDSPILVGAFAPIAVYVMQVGLERLRGAWNEHYVHSKKGRPGSGGRPSARMQARPHPGVRLAMPPGMDVYAEWSAAGLAPLSFEPDNAAERDRLHGFPPQQRLRQAGAALIHPHWRMPAVRTPPTHIVCMLSAAVVQVIGDVSHAWDELLHSNFRRFFDAYDKWLSF